MKKKVYFAGSIRGGRQDAKLYKRIIEYIQQRHVVLTEHVGDLSKSKTEGLIDRDVAIYEQDTACELIFDLEPEYARSLVPEGRSRPKYHVFGHVHQKGLKRKAAPGGTAYLNVSYFEFLRMGLY